MPVPGQVNALGSVSFGWLHEQVGLTFDERFFLDVHERLRGEARARGLMAERFSQEPIYSIEAHLVQPEGRRLPVALVGALQPNLILGAALGAELRFPGDRDPEMTPAPLAGIRDLDPLWNIDWSSTWPISLFLEQIQALQATSEAGHTVVPPFFWDTSGRATIHGILTTAHQLLGERVFRDMVDDPAFVGECFRWIASAYIKLVRLMSRAAGLEVTGLHAGECSVCMIGPAQFERFVLPHLNHLAEELGPLRLHSCGPSDHLLGLFRDVKNLGSLNVGSGTSVAKIREDFGGMRVDLIPHVDLVTCATTQPIEAWARQAVAENDGGELELQFHLDAGQPMANGLAVCRTLREMGVPLPREEIY